MSADAPEKRSRELEEVRHALRKHLDRCLRIKRTSVFDIQHETEIDLTPSEEKAMRRQIQASHGYLFELEVVFEPKHKRRRKIATIIGIKAKRRRIPLQV